MLAPPLSACVAGSHEFILEHAPSLNSAAALPRKRTLLLVDDDENILTSLRRLLRRNGYEILLANSGEQGLALLKQHSVDVILSDQRMPNMTGVEFLRRVKLSYPATVRVVLSGYTELKSITDAINEGAIYKFLTKPWDDNQLCAAIAEAFIHKELADDNMRLHAQVKHSNAELAAANAQLQVLLAERERQLSLDDASLGVAREILHKMPCPVIGFDDAGMIVFANMEGDRIIGNGSPLAGSFAEDRLPGPLQTLFESAESNELIWNGGDREWRVTCHVMGERSRAQGKLMMFVDGS